MLRRSPLTVEAVDGAAWLGTTDTEPSEYPSVLMCARPGQARPGQAHRTTSSSFSSRDTWRYSWQSATMQMCARHACSTCGCMQHHETTCDTCRAQETASTRARATYEITCHYRTCTIQHAACSVHHTSSTHSRDQINVRRDHARCCDQRYQPCFAYVSESHRRRRVLDLEVHAECVRARLERRDPLQSREHSAVGTCADVR